MKKYIRPDVNIVTFEVEDIITVSGLIVNKSELEGKDLDIYTAYTKNFCEGLLPQGFIRKSVAKWMRTDEND